MPTPNAYDHVAFYTEGGPNTDETVEHTGLFCHCGREVCSTMNDPEVLSGWAHVGVGDKRDPTPGEA